MTACADENVSLEEHEKLVEKNEDLNNKILELEERLEEKEVELKNASAHTEENTDKEEIEEKLKEEQEEKAAAEEEAKKKEKEVEEKEREKIEPVEEEEQEVEQEEETKEEVSADDLESEIENVLENSRPMEASVSQGLDDNFITLEGRGKDGFTDSQIGRRVKEDMAKILITFKENDINFEEVRISFYLPTVNAYGEEGQSNMALGVFDKEAVERLEVENEHY